MSYEVQIQFTSPDKWFQPFSWGIRLFEGTKYSHVRLAWKSTSGEDLIYEASGSSVKLIGRYAVDSHKVKIHHTYTLSLTREQYIKMISLFRFASVKYGLLQVLGIAIAKILHLKTNPFDSGKQRQVCSELIGFFLIDVMSLHIEESLDLIGPKGIKEILDKM